MCRKLAALFDAVVPNLYESRDASGGGGDIGLGDSPSLVAGE